MSYDKSREMSYEVLSQVTVKERTACPWTMSTNGEHAPLLGSQGEPNPVCNADFSNVASQNAAQRRATLVRTIVYGVLSVAFIVLLLGMLFFWEHVGRLAGALPKDPQKAAQRVLEAAPVIVRGCMTLIKLLNTHTNRLIQSQWV